MPAPETDATTGLKAVSNLADHVSDYVETYVKLTTLNATQQAAEAATISFTVVIVSFFGIITMIFLGFGLAAWLGESMTVKVGYFVVAMIYALLTFFFLALRKRYIFPFIRNQVVSKMYGNKD